MSSWYFSSPISFTVTEQPKALKECRERFEPRETRVDVRLLPTGHLDLMLRTAQGDVAVPQNHNRIPNPAEPGKWWITDRVTLPVARARPRRPSGGAQADHVDGRLSREPPVRVSRPRVDEPTCSGTWRAAFGHRVEITGKIWGGW